MKELMVVSEVTTNGVVGGRCGIIGAAASAPSAAAASATPPQALLERLKDYGQEDAFALWDELSPEERDLLVRDIQGLDLARVDRIIRCSFRSQGAPTPAIEPVPETSVSTVEERTMEERERWWKMGLKAISEGRLAVLLLSGGQVLDSHQENHYFNCKPSEFYASKGLQLNQMIVTFFQQGTIPCVSKDGRFIMETPNKLAKSPDGNGGVYSALKSSKLLEDMAKRGVRYVDCYGVDNALVRVADPTFVGYFIDKGVASAAKVVRKAYPQEQVGVFVRRGRGGPLSVLEYGEMDPSMTLEINQITGRLRFCWSNVCLHMFTLDFLNQVAHGLEKDSMWKFYCECSYHLAEKRIPSVNGYTAGLKLEQFIFDAFSYAPSTALFEVLREEEFAPVKNANGSTYDTPDTARLLVLRLHSRWVVAAGGFLTHSVPLYATAL
ncbi:UDP-N-acetylglucosamine diphosphorylase 2 [Acorus calamus]|uniref:UDP-N-acetylglucosamine diphosphorylase n=1 Tax=Acorus calamus TaxID=4465 RepID=A0AAV9FKN0_ACOCL|nr:UDP-N-acetylglucosamine diphosphorylase 2 [Acorus calamus]